MMHEMHCSQVNSHLIDRRNLRSHSFGRRTSSRTFNVIDALISGVETRVCPHNAEVRPLSELKDENLLQEISTADQPAANDTTATAPLMQAAQPDPTPRSRARREFEFPGVLASVPAYRDQIMEFVSEFCPDEDDRIDLIVAIQEALANAALHGCKDDPLNRVRCVVAIDGSSVTITVRDPGPGFDLAMADPEKYEASTLTHGRGICLMRSLVSDVSFAHNGAEIQLRKQVNRGG